MVILLMELRGLGIGPLTFTVSYERLHCPISQELVPLLWIRQSGSMERISVENHRADNEQGLEFKFCFYISVSTCTGGLSDTDTKNRTSFPCTNAGECKTIA